VGARRATLAGRKEKDIVAKKVNKVSPDAAASTASEAAAQVSAIATALALPEALPTKERKTVQGRTSHVTDAMIETLASISDQHGGSVAGLPFDATEARTTLAKASEMRSLSRTARVLARKADTSALVMRAQVVDRAFGIYVALERFVHTPEGAPFRTAYEELRNANRSRRRARVGSAPAAAPAETPANASPSNGASHAITLQGTIGSGAATAITNGTAAAPKPA
jgi:hypothetical protein